MSLLFKLSGILIILATLLSMYRMIIGPTLPDRVVALDFLTNLFMAAIALFSIYKKQPIYLDMIVILALVMFLSSIMYAYFLEKRRTQKENQDGYFI